MYRVPEMQIIVDMVKRFDRRIGLRMLYSRYDIPKQDREKYRELWSKFYDLLPDAFEKEVTDESGAEETEEVESEASV